MRCFWLALGRFAAKHLSSPWMEDWLVFWSLVPGGRDVQAHNLCWVGRWHEQETTVHTCTDRRQDTSIGISTPQHCSSGANAKHAETVIFSIHRWRELVFITRLAEFGPRTQTCMPRLTELRTLTTLVSTRDTGQEATFAWVVACWTSGYTLRLAATHQPRVLMYPCSWCLSSEDLRSGP